MNSLGDLVENLKNVGADRLVDLLRDVHTGGVRLDWSNVASAAASSENRTPVARAAPRGDPTPASQRRGAVTPSDAEPYDGARRFFVELEQKLEKQQSTADTVIDRLRSRDRIAGAAPPQPQASTAAQQLVSIVALAGTRAGGRFVVVQPSDSPARVELRVGPLRGADGRSIPAAVTLEPAAFEMEPRSRRVVRVTFDLSGCTIADRERLTATIDACGPRGRTLMKMLVEVDVHAPEGDDSAS